MGGVRHEPIAYAHDGELPSADDASKDVAALLWASDLATLKRFYRQPYWEAEALASDQAAEIEGDLRLESVADHSWKVADGVATLIDHFPWLDKSRALELAILHDKLELITGDWSPIDADGTGATTHAFNRDQEQHKRTAELKALETYQSRLRGPLAERQSALLRDLIFSTSQEACFIKAVDKLSSLMFVIRAKRGVLDPRHYDFTVRYSAKAVEHFPALAQHYKVLVDLLDESVAQQSGEGVHGDGDFTAANCAVWQVR